MAQRTRRAVEFEDEGPGSAILARFLVWAGLTAIALGSAALAAQTQTGAERIARIIGNYTPVTAHGRLAPRANPATPPIPNSKPVVSPIRCAPLPPIATGCS